ncbi:MAG: efflux RND transporter periplasmic adaptor subunit [Lachnospiraceae bacterium]|nr:efflux RND transporter periplasmic adaptor subunit [Lachnospiraceae bacterium]
MDKSARGKKIIKWLVVLVVLGAIGFFVYRKVQDVKRQTEMLLGQDTFDTVTVEKRDLMSTVATTGTVVSEDTRTISAALKDTKVEHINVSVGDYVEQGDLLVTFTVDSINQEIADLQQDIAENKAVQNIDSGNSERAYYYSFGTESITIRDLQTKIDRAQKDLYEACDAYGTLKKEKQDKIDSGELSPEDAEQMYADRIANAYMAQEKAQLNLDDAKQALIDEIYKGSNTLANSADTYNKNTIKSSDSTNTLERQLRNYLDSLDNYQVTAPVSGLVTKIDVQEGNSFTGGNILTIQDTDSFYVSTEIDEYDIPDIELGQRVVIRTDATRDDELDGVVDTIAPTATTSSSSGSSGQSSGSSNATYTVKIRILTADDRLRLGMTAKLSIIIDEKKDVLTVPYDAIYEKASGESYVNVVDNSKPVIIPNADETPEKKKGIMGLFDFGKKEVPTPEQEAANQKEVIVKVGLESDYYSEISGDGIKEGTVVVLPSADDKTLSLEDIIMGP